MRWALFGIALGFLLAGTILSDLPPTAHQDKASHATAGKEEKKDKPTESFWKRATDDPTAFFTLWLALFTAGLTASTVGLWYVTNRTLRHNREEFELTFRARVSIIHVEINRVVDAEGKRGKVEINFSLENTGQLPATKLSLHSSFGFGKMGWGLTPVRDDRFIAQLRESADLVLATREITKHTFMFDDVHPKNYEMVEIDQNNITLGIVAAYEDGFGRDMTTWKWLKWYPKKGKGAFGEYNSRQD
jgi:hypothetical protein